MAIRSTQLKHVHEAVTYSVHSVVFSLLTNLGNIAPPNSTCCSVVVELVNYISARKVNKKSRNCFRSSEFIQFSSCFAFIQEGSNEINTFSPILFRLRKSP